jgi:signal transduction histidine kinase
MYADAVLAADAAGPVHQYVDQVEPAETRLQRLTRRFRLVNPWVIDGVLGTLFTVVGLIGVFAGVDTSKGFRKGDGLAVALTLACTLPYYVRRRFPLLSGMASLAALVALATSGYQSSVQSQMVLVTTYTFGSHCDRRQRVIGLAWLVVGLAVTAIIGIPDTTTANLAVSGVIYMAAYFFGSALRNRRLYMEQLEERAAAAERERDEESRRAVADERLRIAQDLHDVVAHSMGVIAVQAGVGAHVIDTDPAEAKKSLEAISHTSRVTLAEIRRMLGVLRADTGAAYAPAPGLADLERLVHDIAVAGLDVDLVVDGAATQVPPGVDFTAYRIVQEALTNVLKHAGPAHANVTIHYEPAALGIEVVDDGRGVNGHAQAGGHGLIGMRERVGVYGGLFEAGPRVGGGFRIAVRLPYGSDE